MRRIALVNFGYSRKFGESTPAWKARAPERRPASFNEPFFTLSLIKTNLPGRGLSNAVCIAPGNGSRDAIRTRSPFGSLRKHLTCERTEVPAVTNGVRGIRGLN